MEVALFTRKPQAVLRPLFTELQTRKCSSHCTVKPDQRYQRSPQQTGKGLGLTQPDLSLAYILAAAKYKL